MRLHWSQWCFAIALVLLVGLATLPTTRWILRRHLLYIEESFSHSPIDVMSVSGTGSIPKRIDWQASRLILDQPGLSTIEKISDAHPSNAFVQSMAAKAALSHWWLNDLDSYIPKSHDIKRGKLLIKISNRGLALDSRRIDFMLARCYGLMASGKEYEARRALIEASNADVFVDDMRTARLAVRRWYRDHSYLGAELEPDVLQADQTISFLSRLAAYWCKRGTDKDRIESAAAVIVLAGKINKQTTSPKGICSLQNAIQYSCYSAIRLVKAPERFRMNGPEEIEEGTKAPDPSLEPIERVPDDDKVILELAGAVDKRAKQLGILSSEADLAQTVRPCMNRVAEIERMEDQAIRGGQSPLERILLSIGFALSASAVLLVSALMRLGQFRWKRTETEFGLLLLLPMSLAIATIFDRGLEDFWAIILLVPMVLTVPLYIATKSRRISFILLASTVGLGFFQGGLELLNEDGRLLWPALAPSMSCGWIISLCLLIPWVLTGISKPKWLMWVLSGVLVLFVSGCIGSGIANQLRWEMTRFTNFLPDMILLACAIGMAPRPQVKLSRIAGPIFLIGVLLFVGSAMLEWSADRMWVRYQDRLEVVASDRTY